MKYENYIKIIMCVALIATCVLIATCKKQSGDDFSGQRTISGSIYFDDTLNGINQSRFIPNQTIFLKSLSDQNTQNFIVSVNSDRYGNFVFNNLGDSNYILYSALDSAGISYAVNVTINASLLDTSVNLTMIPDTTKYNFLNIICYDQRTGGLLTKIPVCFFTSLQVADSGLCKGSFASGVTNAYGRITVSKTAAAEIYFNAYDTVGNTQIRAMDSVFMPLLGIRQKSVYLK